MYDLPVRQADRDEIATIAQSATSGVGKKAVFEKSSF
jgi:hypothetical protein